PLETSSCNADPGTARLYTLDLITAGPVDDLNGDGHLDVDDRETVLSHGTVPPGVMFLFLQNDDGTVDVTSLTGLSDDKSPLGNTNTIRRTWWNIETPLDK